MFDLIFSSIERLLRKIVDGSQSTKTLDWYWNPIKSLDGYEGDDFYASEISRWKVAWAQPFGSFGEIVWTVALTSQPIWPSWIGTSLVVPPSGWINPSIVSTSVEDGDTLTGIRTVHVHYLDGNLNQASEVVQLNWTTPVSMVATDVRFVQCMHVWTFWSAKAAVGNISLSSGWTTYSYIKAWMRRCSSSFRRVPAWKRLMIKSMYAGSISGTASAWTVVKLVMTYIEWHDYTESSITIPNSEIAIQDMSVSLTNDMPIPVPAWVVVWFETTTDKAATVTAGFFWYIENA